MSTIIEKVLEHTKLNPAELARSIGLKRPQAIYDIINGKTKNISNRMACKIISVFPVFNKSWLMTGEGEMLKLIKQPTPNDNQPTLLVERANLQTGIPLIPIEVFCGYGTPTFEDQSIEEYYHVAEFKQADFLMRVKGNSMYPKYSSGDIIACRKIQDMLFFQWNKIYAIYTNSQGVMVKRVRESARGDEYITLVSDNSNYAPFDVPRSDIAAIALVIGVIRVE